LEWLDETDFKYKLLIAGNHDFFVEDHPKLFKSLLSSTIIYLETHTPPYDILDRTGAGYSVGCEVLKEKVLAIAPKVHVFGHVHASYGQEEWHDTLFINASNISSEMQRLVNLPIEIEWPLTGLIDNIN